MSNPFEPNNPWQNNPPPSQPTGGPRYGNAYESNPPYGNAYDNNPPHGNAYEQSSVPRFSATGYNNAWGEESNKIQDESSSWNSPTPQPMYPPQSPYATHTTPPATNNAYQFSGTSYGNQPQTLGNAYSPQSLHSSTPLPPTKPAEQVASAGPEPWNGEIYHTPNKWRFWFRFGILLTSIGHLGFAAGARPYSGEDVPFSSSSCFYYLFAVAIMSIIWTVYLIIFYFYRRMLKKPKMNRPIMFGIDLFLAILWGIGILVEIIKFRCTSGGKFCAFYNVSIFWGFLAFVAYILAVIWDIYGGCCSNRRKN
ncbi:uncharacterized protein BX663DRAFT_495017 [Cokeromyces recurvatus]|uniref:uncharacterized protein n=1 Tax=Cokeromyces recurvatus TaxID=90255 RepID=UPI00221E3EA8|nr:uncharacterized protein BX663DRAFT_495017 [Cokeromyces recurvatus]KAI7907156.1 hypothetical protein BX663DRAFT_495017 [Cokeromyces recurvatus]